MEKQQEDETPTSTPHLFQIDSREAMRVPSGQSNWLARATHYQPQEDQETYYINSEGHFQCHQNSQKIITAKTPQELPQSREHPIYQNPCSVTVSSVEDLQRLYPNSFGRLGSLKGEYDIKVDPTVPPVKHARRKMPIESKAAIKEAIDYMVQYGPSHWVK